MASNASGEHAVDCAEDAIGGEDEEQEEEDEELGAFSSSNIALAWDNAVGSTGSLISSCTSWGVRRVSILAGRWWDEKAATAMMGMTLSSS